MGSFTTTVGTEIRYKDFTNISVLNIRHGDSQFGARGELVPQFGSAFCLEGPIGTLIEPPEKSRLELLLELTSQIVSDVDLRDLLRTTVKSLCRVVQSDGACVFLAVRQNGELEVYALDFPSGTADLQEETPIAVKGTIAGRVFRTERLWSGTVNEAHGLLAGDDPAPFTSGFKTGCMLPIRSRDRVLGTLGLGRLDSDAYREDDLEFLDQVSKQIAVAVENALLYQENRTLKEKLARERVCVQEELPSDVEFEEIVGKSPAIRRALNEVQIVAPTDSTVLICGETGAGMLLDIANLHANAGNHRFDAYEFLDALPAAIVKQVHIAGGIVIEGDFPVQPLLADSHSHPVPEAAFELLDYALARCAPASVILERDERLDATDEILDDVARIRAHLACPIEKHPDTEAIAGSTS